MATGEIPFQMAVLGDSVLWGSGLAEDDKAWRLVGRWIERRIGRPVRVQVLAHSLADVVPDPARDADPAAWGEIRFHHPSITYQALSDPRRSDPAPQAVDLVLVDGGINDLGPLNLLLPWRAPRWVREEAAEHCGRKMKDLLLPLLDTFSKARVVVTGYYPPASSRTWFIRALAPVPGLRRRLIDLSLEWARASEEWLRWAAYQANLHASAAAAPRVFSAGAAFRPENCYGAPDTYLWTLGQALTDGSAVGRRRRCECLRLKAWDPICYVDMAFHPNPKGAQAYAASIIAILEPVLPSVR
jgi:lysophospholipase L1-like esterase